MDNRVLLTLAAFLILFKAKGNDGNASSALTFPNGHGGARDCDPSGCGHYGASRGNRVHKGFDFLVNPGDVISSPIYGTVNRYAYPYADDISYKGVEIIGTGIHEGYRVKMFYLLPSVEVGTLLRPGQAVGHAQNIALKYGLSMKPHIHMELYINNSTVDPLLYF